MLLLVALKASHHRFNASMVPAFPNFNSWIRKSGNGGKSPAASSDGPRPLVYATPSQPIDSMIYYAPTGLSMVESSCVSMTQFEVPPHMVSVQRLPNGNIHVTLPTVRPMVRPSIFTAQQLSAANLALAAAPGLPRTPPSPTSSQILYSFDHEPFYDTPPDNIYEELVTTSTQHTVC